MIIFENPGKLPIECVRTMGVSVKKTKTPIGYFGTGLKYAIAVILNNGGKITIWQGGDKWEFGSKVVNIREDDFKIATLNGQELPFTLNLGQNWEPWMAFRELYCNAIDEGGSCRAAISQPASYRADWTTIIVEGCNFDNIFDRMNEIILTSSPKEVLDEVSIHAGKSEFIYYRNLRVMGSIKPSHVTWNIQRKIKLTEDRTVYSQFEISLIIAKAFVNCRDEELIEQCLTDKNCYEYDLPISHLDIEKDSPFWNVMSRMMQSKSMTVSQNLRDLWQVHTPVNTTSISLSSTDQVNLDRAIFLMNKIGTPIGSIEICTVESLGPSILGAFINGRIMLSRLAFQQGFRRLFGTLFEERAHAIFGYTDCTRDLQNYLIDQIAEMAEHATEHSSRSAMSFTT